MATQKLITVYGTGKAKLIAGKPYIVSEEQASVLIAKGAAIKNQPKTKEK